MTTENINKSNFDINAMGLFSKFEGHQFDEGDCDNIVNSIIKIQEMENKVIALFDGLKEADFLRAFIFEYLMDKYRREIPNVINSVYPLMLADLITIPNFSKSLKEMYSLLNAVRKQMGKDSLTKEEAKFILLEKNYTPISATNVFGNKVKTQLNEMSVIVDKYFDEIIDTYAIHLVLDENVEKEMKKHPFEGKDDIIKKLSKGKAIHLFLSYVTDLYKTDEFLNYLGNNLVRSIMIDSSYDVFSEKIMTQFNVIIQKET